MKKLYLKILVSFAFVFNLLSVLSQTQYELSISSTLSGNLTACLNEATYTVNIENISPFNLSQINVKLMLPNGLHYVTGSVQGAIESGTTTTDSISFTMSDLSAHPSSDRFATFSVRLTAGCATEYSMKKNIFKISYVGTNSSGGTITRTVTHESNLYNISRPDLSLTAMTNRIYTGDVGDVFTRCITIINGGNGSLSTFDLKHEHGAGLTIQSSDYGTMIPISGGTIHRFSASDFVNIGNGNNTFDPGESITICETIRIDNCSDAQTNYKYSWGCNGQTCQEMPDAGNILFQSEAPNLVLTPSNTFSNTLGGLGSNCYGNTNSGFTSSLNVANTGIGDATNISVRIYNSTSSPQYSSIDLSSITIQIGNGPQQAATVTNSTNATQPCLPANSKASFTVQIPNIPAGQNVTISWRHFSCCYNDCNNDTKYMFQWRAKANYTNTCGQPKSIDKIGFDGSYYGNKLITDLIPGTIMNGETTNIRFLSTSFPLSIPRNNNSEFRYRFVFSDDCIKMSPNSLVIKNAAGVQQTIPPHTVQTSGNTVDYIFTSAIPMGINWTIALDITTNCDECVTDGIKTIQFQTLYRPGGNCNCLLLLGCASSNINALCPPECIGTNLVSSTIRRINLGQPDQANNGSINGVHNLSNIRTDRMMHGDTLAVYNASYINNPDNLDLSSIILRHKMNNRGDRMTYLRSAIRIYRSASNSYQNYNGDINFDVNTIVNTREWQHGFNIYSIPTLNIPQGIPLQTGDSVLITSFYVNTINNDVGNYISDVVVTSNMLGSENTNYSSIPSSEFLGCNQTQSTFTMIGWKIQNSRVDGSSLSSNCQNITVKQNFQLKISSSNNDAGVNMFPYEYRRWVTPTRVFVEIPDGYVFVNAQYQFIRTAGNSSSSSANINVNPISINGNVYEFNIQTVSSPSIGSPPTTVNSISDDDFTGRISITLKPRCIHPDNNYSKPVKFRWKYNLHSQLASYSSDTMTNWSNNYVNHYSPGIQITPTIHMVNSENGIVEWDLQIKNSSITTGTPNFWLALEPNNDVEATEIQNVATGTSYFPNANGIFNLPNLPINSPTITYRLTTRMTGCNHTSFNVLTGWGCFGVPTSLDDACVSSSRNIALTINPLKPAFETQLVNISSGDKELCDDLDFEIIVRNYQLGYGYNMITEVDLPQGIHIIPGTSYINYNNNNHPIPNPSLVSGSIYHWNLSNHTLLSNGLNGISDTTKNFYKIRFKARAICGFTSGQRMYARAVGESFCGSTHASEWNYSQQLYLSNAVPPYATSINMTLNFITPCGPNNNPTLSIINEGTIPLGDRDSIYFVMPNGINYLPNTFTPIHNATITQTEPRIDNSGGQTTLIWPVLGGINPGDSMVFSFNIEPSPQVLTCASTELRTYTSTLISATCSTNGETCNTVVITGEDIKPIYVYKTDFNVNNARGKVKLNADGTEIFSGYFTLINQGADLNNQLVFELIQDLNGDGAITSNEPIIWTHTTNVNIASGASSTMNILDIPVTRFCNGIIRISLADNACLCADKVFPLQIELLDSEIDTTLCMQNKDTICGSTNPFFMSTPNPNNLYYGEWGNVGLGIHLIRNEKTQYYNGCIDTFSSDTINHYFFPIEFGTFNYMRKVEKGGCFHTQFYEIKVTKPIEGMIDVPNNICGLGTPVDFNIYINNGQPNYTVTYTVNGDTLTQTTHGNRISHTIPNPTPGIYDIKIINIEDRLGCNALALDSARIIISPLPEATITGDTVLCQGSERPFVTFTGEHGVPPYTFTYVYNNTTFQTSSMAYDAQIAINTDSAGVFPIRLISVKESSPSQCSTTLNDSVVVVILPQPKATIKQDTIVCQNDSPPVVTLTGIIGTPNYTFYYSIDGVADSMVSVGNTASFSIPTATVGQTTVQLTGIKESSEKVCSSVLDTSIIIQVNPLPTASFVGDSILCQGGNITFNASNGTAPYTIYFTRNGEADSVVTTGNTATINHPTAGTFAYTITKVKDASSTRCENTIIDNANVTVVVLPTPTATIGEDIVVCQNEASPVVTFTGADGTPNYTFFYNLAGVPTSIVSLGNTATINIPTIIAGQVTIQLTGVEDASARTCSNVLDTSITITVTPMPTASITRDTTVCQGSNPPVLTLSGIDGVAPYTFTYIYNNDTLQTTSIGNDAQISINTDSVGTFPIRILSIKSAGSNQCENTSNAFATVVVLPLPKATLQKDTTVCQHDTPPVITLTGSNGTPNYTFYYSIAGISDSIISVGNSVSFNIPTAIVGQATVQLTGVKDASMRTCYSAVDTNITIRVNPLPTASIFGDTIVCQHDSLPIITFAGANATAPYTIYYTLNGVADSITTFGDSITLAHPTNQVGTFTYTLTSVKDASESQCRQMANGSVTIVILPTPTASIQQDTIVCHNATPPVVRFIGGNSTPNYTFYYSIDGFSDSIVSTGNTAEINIPTLTVGQINVQLTGVKDASVRTCYNAIDTNISVTVSPLPLASISSDTIVCHQDAPTVVTFTGYNSTPNYTFYYSIDGVADSILSNGDTTTISIPTTTVGLVSVQLTGVKDATVRNCYSVLDTSLTIRINPLPTATIFGNATVCQYDTMPIVTFSGVNATAPYTIYYTLNGVADSITTLGDSITLAHPTNQHDTFTYVLTNVKDASPTQCRQVISDSISIIVRDRPDANIIGNQEVCEKAPDVPIQFIASGTSSPYTFDYTLNGIPLSITTTVEDTSIMQSTNIVDEFVYNLVRVTDTFGCHRDTNLSVTVKINELPLANIFGNATICFEAEQPTILFVGEKGTPGYQFDYSIVELGQNFSINSGNDFSTSILGINDSVGIFTYVLTGVTDASNTQCYQALNDSIRIQVNPLPTASITGFVPICQNQPSPMVILHGKDGGSPYTFNYTINGVAYTATTNNNQDSIILLQPTNKAGNYLYTITSITEGDYGCQSIVNESFLGTIHPNPTSYFTVSPNELSTSNSVAYFTNESLGAVSYSWNFGDGNSNTNEHPIHNYDVEDVEYFDIQLITISQHGCVDSFSYTINIKEEVLVYVPNAFTPNDDRHNQTFKPIITQGIEIQYYTMEIYNRWGEKIFESNDLDTGWDGTYKGRIVQDGVYTYVIYLTHKEEGIRKRINGHVTLFK